MWATERGSRWDEKKTPAYAGEDAFNADIRWAEVESLLNALGVELVERAGSRVQLFKGNESIVVHRPHPRPETRRDTVRDITRFIDRISGAD